jgi:hypothetical protein
MTGAAPAGGKLYSLHGMELLLLLARRNAVGACYRPVRGL